jgi:uncharacterized small protein (DUF1192 family)
LQQQVNINAMDEDDFTTGFTAAKGDDVLAQLAKTDLDPLSIDELNERVAALKAEITRCEAHRDKASSHRLAAEALFGNKKS